jgi:hypothetical protein
LDESLRLFFKNRSKSCPPFLRFLDSSDSEQLKPFRGLLARTCLAAFFAAVPSGGRDPYTSPEHPEFHHASNIFRPRHSA